ncbi:MAG: hypothetical protein LUG99_08630 [Lachnospiraceae bacterium]|nr:hypothetical protein [Lachnospiraceae bacterium]
MELYRLYYDDSGFHNRLHREVIESTYPTLSASAPAETFNIWQLSETAAEEYNAIKERYQSTLVGFEQHGYFEFYGDDARLVSQIIRSRVFEKPTGTDTRLFTAFPVDQWSAFSEMIRKKGESLALMNERADGTHRLMKYFNWKDYLPLDALIHVDGREFRIDTVDYQTGVVSLQDMTMAKEARYPIFRNESVEFVRSYYEEEAPAYDFSTEIRVMDALEQSGVSHDDFSGEQMDVIYDAAQKELDLEPLADPDFPPEQMQLIVDAEERLRESGDGIPADLLGLLSEDVMTLEEVDAARAKYQLPQEGDEKEKKNEKTEAGANPGEASRGELTPSERFSVIDVDWHPSKKEYSIWDSRLNNYYINADGNTVVFDSRWQAEDYRNDLIENYQTKAQFPPLERAKQLLNWYSIAEFGVPADFDDPAKVGIGYTTVGEEELPIEVFVNLVDFRLERFFNNELIETRQYDSMEDLIAVELGNLDYDELVSVSDEEIEAAKAVHQVTADPAGDIELRSIVLELNPDRSEEQESSEESKQKESESSLSEQHVSEQFASEQPEVETNPGSEQNNHPEVETNPDPEQEQPEAAAEPDSKQKQQERIRMKEKREKEQAVWTAKFDKLLQPSIERKYGADYFEKIPPEEAAGYFSRIEDLSAQGSGELGDKEHGGGDRNGHLGGYEDH